MTNVKTHDDIVTKYCLVCNEPYYEHGIAKIKIKDCLLCGAVDHQTQAFNGAMAVYAAFRIPTLYDNFLEDKRKGASDGF